MTTAIEWTDATWNPTVGCSIVSPGCHNCYAATMAKRLRAMGQAPYQDVVDDSGRWTGKVNVVEDKLLLPLRWKKPRMVFVDSMSDLFHEEISDLAIDQIFATMMLAKRHTFQVLTKRPKRMARLMNDPGSLSLIAGHAALAGYGEESMQFTWPPPNVWLGVSAEDQKRADERIPHLLKTPAAVRFVSAEPLLGPIDFSKWIALRSFEDGCLDWIIVGGESGAGARLCSTGWGRVIVNQCQTAGVPVFVKQLGRNLGMANCDASLPSIRDKKGGDPAEWPADLRVREYPQTVNR